MGLNFRGVALFPSPSALNTLCGILYHKHFERGWGVRAAARSFEVTPSFILAEVTPLPAILYHKDFDRGESARPRAPSRLNPRLFLLRLHPNGKRWSRLFLLRLHPNGKRCLFLLTLSFANCKRNRCFLVLCFCTVI